MNLVDTHCHIDVAAFDVDRTEVLDRCRSSGVTRIVVPGIMANSWEKLQKTCDANPGLYASFGLHPVYLDQHSSDDIDALSERVQHQRPIAVGEIGLDYFLDGLDRDRQKSLFQAQLMVAKNASLPVLLHVRKSHDDVLSLLRKTKVCGGICHAFNGSLQQAQQYIDLGFKLGFGGMLTFDRSHKLHHLAQQLPLEAIVLETDAPDMTGASHHGQRNSPEYLPEYLAALASIRKEDVELVAAQTTANAEFVLDFSRTNI